MHIAVAVFNFVHAKKNIVLKVNIRRNLSHRFPSNLRIEQDFSHLTNQIIKWQLRSICSIEPNKIRMKYNFMDFNE